MRNFLLTLSLSEHVYVIDYSSVVKKKNHVEKRNLLAKSGRCPGEENIEPRKREETEEMG